MKKYEVTMDESLADTLTYISARLDCNRAEALRRAINLLVAAESAKEIWLLMENGTQSQVLLK